MFIVVLLFFSPSRSYYTLDGLNGLLPGPLVSGSASPCSPGDLVGNYLQVLGRSRSRVGQRPARELTVGVA